MVGLRDDSSRTELLAVMSSLRVEAGLVGTALDESPAGVGRRSGLG
jgi:hypothetical protein